MFDINLDFSKIRYFCKFWPNSRNLEFFDFDQGFPKILTQIEIIRKSSPKSRHLKIWPKSLLLIFFFQNPDFSNVWYKFRFFENLTKIVIFRKFWPKSRFFENFVQNRDLQTFWPKSRYFENHHQNRYLFKDFDQNLYFLFFFLPKSGSFECLT